MNLTNSLTQTDDFRDFLKISDFSKKVKVFKRKRDEAVCTISQRSNGDFPKIPLLVYIMR